jgi:serine/threonine protein phosphatase PrpC
VREIKDTVRSTVTIGYDGRVHKTFRGTDADKRFATEVKVLKYLENCGCNYVPQVLEHDPLRLYMVTTNCGQPVEDTISEKKSASLYQSLREDFGVSHGDEFPRNITYDPLRGRFCVIDFELAEIIEEKTPKSQGLEFHWAGDSISGTRKPENDDSLIVFTCQNERATEQQQDGTITIVNRDLVFAVSDGMGGGNAGDMASQLILRKLSKFIPRTLIGATNAPDDYFLSCLEHALLDVHRELNKLSAADENLSGMGATLCLAWFSPGRMHCAHAGDSRIYRLRDGELAQLTKDHTFAFAQYKRGEITEYQFRQHPRRAALYEVLGAQHQNVHPQLFTEHYLPGDRYLICSDGVIDGLWDRQIREFLSQEIPPAMVVRELLSKATNAAGKDDTTAVLIEVV